jgi:hypothetical protein
MTRIEKKLKRLNSQKIHDPPMMIGLMNWTALFKKKVLKWPNT